MPYENYLTEEEFHEMCFYWGCIERELDSRYKPNPWIFKVGYRLCPNEEKYTFTYRNFDDSQHLHFQFSCKDGKPSFRFLDSL